MPFKLTLGKRFVLIIHVCLIFSACSNLGGTDDLYEERQNILEIAFGQGAYDNRSLSFRATSFYVSYGFFIHRDALHIAFLDDSGEISSHEIRIEECAYTLSKLAELGEAAVEATKIVSGIQDPYPTGNTIYVDGPKYILELMPFGSMTWIEFEGGENSKSTSRWINSALDVFSSYKECGN